MIEEYKPQFPPRHEFTDDELRAIDVPRTTHALPLQEPDLTISRILALVEDDRSDLPE